MSPRSIVRGSRGCFRSSVAAREERIENGCLGRGERRRRGGAERRYSSPQRASVARGASSSARPPRAFTGRGSTPTGTAGPASRTDTGSCHISPGPSFDIRPPSRSNSLRLGSAGGPAALRILKIVGFGKDSRPTGAGHSSRAAARIGRRPCRPADSEDRGFWQRFATNGSRPIQPSGSSYWPAALPPSGILFSVAANRLLSGTNW